MGLLRDTCERAAAAAAEGARASAAAETGEAFETACAVDGGFHACSVNSTSERGLASQVRAPIQVLNLCPPISVRWRLLKVIDGGWMEFESDMMECHRFILYCQSFVELPWRLDPRPGWRHLFLCNGGASQGQRQTRVHPQTRQG